MAKTKKGKKKVYVQAYTKKDGTKVRVSTKEERTLLKSKKAA